MVDPYIPAGVPQTSGGIGGQQAAVNSEGLTLPTYSAGITGLVAANSATDVFTLIGSATRTVRVKRIYVAGRATAAVNADVQILKRSTADTSGTSTAPTVVPHDSADAAGTAVAAAYTVNPTTGTMVGLIRSIQVPLGNLTTGLGTGATLLFSDQNDKAIVLRGVAQQLCINLNATTYSGNLLDIYVEWTEDNS